MYEIYDWKKNFFREENVAASMKYLLNREKYLKNGYFDYFILDHPVHLVCKQKCLVWGPQKKTFKFLM